MSNQYTSRRLQTRMPIGVPQYRRGSMGGRSTYPMYGMPLQQQPLRKARGRQVNGSTRTGGKQIVIHQHITAPQGQPINGGPVTPVPVDQGNVDLQKLIRETYKQCLDKQASQGRFLTSQQRQSLLQVVSTEVAAQQPNGSQGSSSQSGLPQSANPSLTMAELVNQLQQRLSISDSRSSPSLPSSAIPISG